MCWFAEILSSTLPTITEVSLSTKRASLVELSMYESGTYTPIMVSVLRHGCFWQLKCYLIAPRIHKQCDKSKGNTQCEYFKPK